MIDSTTAAAAAPRALSNELLLELFRSGAITLEMLLENGTFPFADKLLQSISRTKDDLNGTVMS